MDTWKSGRIIRKAKDLMMVNRREYAGGPAYKEQEKTLNINDMNPAVKLMSYNLRGALIVRANEIVQEMNAGKKKPFSRIIRANLGDAQAMGQPALTFVRQLKATCLYPDLMRDPDIPEDVKKRAKDILKGCRFESIGAYSHPSGLAVVRKHCAEYIAKRDGFPCNWEDLVLTSGCTQAIKGTLKLLSCKVAGKKTGVLLPIPEFPVYSAAVYEYNMEPQKYYLDEDKGWALDIHELERVVKTAKATCTPRVIIVCNPGNPTAQILPKKNIQDIIKFCHSEGLYIIADEVYQTNIYDQTMPFHSFKKVACELGEPYSRMEMSVCMSASKGFICECGCRGGYMELLNLDPKIRSVFSRYLEVNLCPPNLGQVVMSAVVKPPVQGEPSYELYNKEKSTILGNLKHRADLVSKYFNSFKGYKMNPIKGSLYAFPKIELPPKLIEAAKKKGQAPDLFYLFELLERTGIVCVPGAGFGQKEGTYHIRTTILPPNDVLQYMLDSFKTFHEDFVKRYE